MKIYIHLNSTLFCGVFAQNATSTGEGGCMKSPLMSSILKKKKKKKRQMGQREYKIATDFLNAEAVNTGRLLDVKQRPLHNRSQEKNFS